jgi:hypothetical protein
MHVARCVATNHTQDFSPPAQTHRRRGRSANQVVSYLPDRLVMACVKGDGRLRRSNNFEASSEGTAELRVVIHKRTRLPTLAHLLDPTLYSLSRHTPYMHQRLHAHHPHQSSHTHVSRRRRLQWQRFVAEPTHTLALSLLPLVMMPCL